MTPEQCVWEAVGVGHTGRERNDQELLHSECEVDWRDPHRLGKWPPRLQAPHPPHAAFAVDFACCRMSGRRRLVARVMVGGRSYGDNSVEARGFTRFCRLQISPQPHVAAFIR